jgi:Amt family ammonium transporter
MGLPVFGARLPRGCSSVVICSTGRVSVQLLGAGVAFVWAFPLALMLYLLLAKTFGLRTSTQHEQRGLDFAEHAEVGYPEFNLAVTFDPNDLPRRV